MSKARSNLLQLRCHLPCRCLLRPHRNQRRPRRGPHAGPDGVLLPAIADSLHLLRQGHLSAVVKSRSDAKAALPQAPLATPSVASPHGTEPLHVSPRPGAVLLLGLGPPIHILAATLRLKCVPHGHFQSGHHHLLQRRSLQLGLPSVQPASRPTAGPPAAVSCDHARAPRRKRLQLAVPPSLP
jgi:hypothetical protein